MILPKRTVVFKVINSMIIKAITVADQKQSICMGNVEKLHTITSNNHESIKKGKENMPSKHKILKKSTFEKPSSDHTFTSEASFEHILIFVLKGSFLLESDKENLLNTHPLIKHFNKMLNWSYNIQFADITNPIKNMQSKNQ